MADGNELISLTIDGIQISVEPGTFVIDAAELRPVLRDQMQTGMLLSVAASVIRTKAEGPIESFIASGEVVLAEE